MTPTPKARRADPARGLVEGIVIATYKGATLSIHSAPGKELLLEEAVACCRMAGLRMEFKLLPKVARARARKGRGSTPSPGLGEKGGGK